MQLPYSNLPQTEVTTRLCWVCGKIGTELGAIYKCYRHPEGDVSWAKFNRGVVVLNRVIMNYGQVVEVVDHTKEHVPCP